MGPTPGHLVVRVGVVPDGLEATDPMEGGELDEEVGINVEEVFD